MLIAQLSDPHIRPHGVLYQGVAPSNAMFEQAIENVLNLDVRPDAIVLTGDLTDDGAPEAYAEARRLIENVGIEVLAIPGNHDDRECFRLAFARDGYLSPDGALHWFVDRGPLRLIGLDTCAQRKHHGELSAHSLEWLGAVLDDDSTRPALIFMHHPPFRCGIRYMDPYRFVDEAELESLIAARANVASVLCGHVHRVMVRPWAGTVVTTAPSTTTEIALQFDARAAPRSWVGPRGYLLHRWTDEDGLLSHVVNTSPSEGPYPFA